MKKYLCVCFFFLLVAGVHPANAQSMVTLEKVFTQITPIFMEDHEGELDWIEGYQFSGDILLNGSKIGDVEGVITLQNPPMDLSQKYGQAFGRFKNDITGVGRFEVFAQLTNFGNMESTMGGEAMLSWHGSIANGSGSLAGLAGLSAGVGTFNPLTLQGSAQEMLIYTLE